MKKLVKLFAILYMSLSLVFVLGLARDKQVLRQDLLRLHIVAASDAPEDQTVKLQVRDAIIQACAEPLSQCSSASEAEAYFAANLERLRNVALKTLQENGFSEDVQVTLSEEAFPRRDYETFSLPAGVYHSLRITIGAGAGKNWWCVMFPRFCNAAATVNETAEVAGISSTLTKTITAEGGYEVRFFLLELWGRIENFFYRGR